MTVPFQPKLARQSGRPGRWMTILSLVLAAIPSSVQSQPKPPEAVVARPFTEYEVKALYLVRFLDYVVWPDSAFADADAPIVIGVLGRNPFEKDLENAAAGRKVQKHGILIRYGRTVEELGPCHLLFAASGEAGRYGDIAQHYAATPVLLVADSPGGLKAGLTLEFRRQENNVRFAVNLGSARRRNLELSARLLSSAVEVVQESAPAGQPHAVPLASVTP